MAQQQERRDTEPGPDVDEVREVLTAIAVEEDLARLGLRLADLEGEVQRAHSHAEEAERSQRGELQVMRARIEDALTLVRTATEEHQQAWSQLERRITEVVGEVDASTARLIEALRDELAPRVHRAALQAEEVEARLQGEVEAGRTETLDALRSVQEETTAAIAASQAHVDGLVTQFSPQLEALRVELDGAVSELRAADSLQAQQVAQAVRDLRAEFLASIEPYVRAAAQREEDLKAAMEDLRRRMQEGAAARASAAERDRAAREEATSKLRSRLEDLASRVEQVDTRSVGQTSRHLAELGQLHRTIEEVGGRVEVLSQRVASAIDGVAGQLATRLSSLAAEVTALHEAGVRQEERLANTERLKRRVAELEARQQDRGRSHSEPPTDEQATDRVTELREQLGSLAGRVGQVESRLAEDVRLDLAPGQAALHQQLSDLAARVEQLGGRVQDAERVAQAAGRAIVSAVRRGHEAPAPSPTRTSPGSASP